MMCSARELGMGDDHGRPADPGGPAGPRGCRSTRCFRPGTRLRHGDHAQPPRLPLAPGPRPRARRVVPPALVYPQEKFRGDVAGPERAATSSAASRWSTPRTARSTRRTSSTGVKVGPQPRLDAGAAEGGRAAPDQQRGRRRQLRDARVRPAAARLRRAQDRGGRIIVRRALRRARRSRPSTARSGRSRRACS
jgi:hypothetical protein